MKIVGELKCIGVVNPPIDKKKFATP